jgi:ABC-type nitrate/sulfonate/bicarbonate transport system permease component
MAFSSPVSRRRLGIRPIRPLHVVAEIAVPSGLVALWWVLSESSTSLYFPPLSQILSSFHKVWLFHDFTADAVPSLENLALGYLAATIIGIVVGVVLGLVPLLSDAVAPALEFLRAIPGVALVPAALLLFGIGPEMKIALIAYGTIWPILLNTVDGIRGLDKVAGDVAASYRIRQRDRLFRIVLPAASPQIVAGMRTALSIGITIIIFSEMVGSTNGIGFRILSAQRSFAVPDMWAGIVLLGILGYLLNLAFRGFEYYLLRWHRGMRQIAGN